jgi:general stress protein 26
VNEDELRDDCIELMETADGVYLTTVSEDGYPRTRAMLNLRNRSQYPDQASLFAEHRGDLLVYFTTNTSSSKVSHIRANPKVCVYYCTPSQFKGLMLSGDIEIVDDPAIRGALWNDGWERYYPGGPDDPDHTVLRLFPRAAEGWWGSHRFAFTIP